LLRPDADDLFALFPDAAAALGCAVEIQEHVRVANEVLPTAEELYVAIGVGYGSVLLIGPDDVYGDEMNLACKLGEDVAERGEVLATQAARAALGDGRGTFEEPNLSVSGLDLPAHRLVS